VSALYSPAGGREGSGKHGLVWPEISNMKIERKGVRLTLQQVSEKDQISTVDFWPEISNIRIERKGVRLTLHQVAKKDQVRTT
jgi:hypothetical protein